MKIKKRNAANIGFDMINAIALLIFTFICIYPFYYILIYSLSNPIDSQKGVFLLPVGVTLQNYIKIFQLKGLGISAVVSISRTLAGTALTAVSCTFFAYLVTKKQLYCRKAIYRFVIISMYLNAGLIPWYLTMKMLHLNNNFLVYILPYTISAYYVILLKTFIEQLPPSLEESAKMDGAGLITIFVKLIFPLSMPIIATITVFAAVAQWNTWFDNYFLVQNPKLKTLQLLLYDYLSEANRIALASSEDLTRGIATRKITPETVRMTITMVVTFPILFVYPFMQKYFVKGIMLGAVKG
jgi:putative aldouronate transport system permease protein